MKTLIQNLASKMTERSRNNVCRVLHYLPHAAAVLAAAATMATLFFAS